MEADDVRAARFKQLVFAGDAEGLRGLFAEHPELNEVIDEPWFYFGAPALVQAAGAKDRDLVDALIDLGADLEARSDWDAGPYSALHRLVDGATPESLALAEHIVSRGAEIDLHAAAGMGRADVIERVLDAEPGRVSEPGPDGATPLHLAKDPEIAALLLDHGAEIDKPCVDHKSTPAMWATDGREDVMRFLVENGAKPDLYMAVLLDDVDLAAELLESEPGAIDVRVRWGVSHEHVGFGDKYIWALNGAETPVELARARDRPGTYAFLLERSSVGVRLVQASRREDIETMERLFSEEPDLLSNIEEREVCEALCGSAAGARVMLGHGADPNARDDGPGATPLHHAAWRALPELAEVLLDGGADPCVRDRANSSTPLGWADYNDQADMVELLKARYSLDIVDAAWLGNVDRVKEILADDASLVNGFDDGKVSPLRTAAWEGHAEVVRLLLEHGVDPSIPNPESGKTALDFATERGHEEVVRLLSDA